MTQSFLMNYTNKNNNRKNYTNDRVILIILALYLYCYSNTVKRERLVIISLSLKINCNWIFFHGSVQKLSSKFMIEYEQIDIKID